MCAQRWRRAAMSYATATGHFGGYQAIWRDPRTGVLHGASEMRTDGAAQGY